MARHFLQIEMWMPGQALAALLAQGFKIDVKPLKWLGDLFVIQLPNGTKYELLAGGILKLKAEGRLSAAGIESAYGRNSEVEEGKVAHRSVR